LMGYFFLFSIFSEEYKKFENGIATDEATIFFIKFLRLFLINKVL